MLKAWILSALGIGVIVTGVILATADDSNSKQRPYVPTWRNLTEQEVRICITTLREHDAIVSADMRAFVESGKNNAAEVRAKVQALARRHQLTRSQMKEIWDRVEKVVNAIRWQEEPSVARNKFEQQLELKRDQTPTTEKDKALQAEEIASLERQLKGEDFPHADKLLVKKYWSDLNEIVPHPFGQ